MDSMRIKRVREKIKELNLDAFFVTKTVNIHYLTGLNCFSDFEQDGYLLLTQKSAILFTNQLYLNEVQQKLKDTDIKIYLTETLQSHTQKIIENENIIRIGFEQEITFYEYQYLKNSFEISFVPTEGVIEEARKIKDKAEIEEIKKSCELSDKAFSYILKSIKTNVTEKEIAFKIEQYVRQNGGELSFPTIVAFGKNSATPHHKTDDTKLKENSIVLLDFGAKINGYCADISRTFFFGKAGIRFKNIYQTVLDAQEASINSIGPNKTFSEVDKTARSFITEKNYPSIPHALGHGVGLEVHEKPSVSRRSEENLDADMVFTIEPGVYLPDFGGIRIEDVIHFDGEKINLLSNSSKELIEITS